MVFAIVSTGTALVGPVSAATLNVAAGSTSQQIQDIIDTAAIGDTIIFAPGEYNDIKIKINKTLDLMGNGAIIKGINETDTNIFTIIAEGDADGSNSKIEGFEFFLLNNNITSGSKTKSTGYAINLDRVNNIVVNNVTSHDGKAAVYNGNSFNTLIENCTFTDDYMKSYSVHIMGGENITVRNSTISGAMDAISIASGAKNVYVDGNTFLNNDFGAFFGGGISYITFINNIFDGFNKGLAIEKSANLTSVINNTFINGNGDAIYIKNSDAHGPWTVITDIEIIGNVFQDIVNGAAIGIDKEGIFHAGGTGDSIIGRNNTVINVENGYVTLYSSGENLNFTMDSSLETPPVEANVSISSTVSSAAIKNGDKATYTVTVKNTGNGDATNVKVSDILRSYYFSSYTTYASQGTYSNGNWNIGTLGAGNTASLVLSATAVKSGLASSQAKVTADDNITATSNKIEKTINKNIKLSYSNSLSKTKVKRNSYVYTTTKVKNSGKDKSNTVKVKITLPKGTKIVNVGNAHVYNKNTKTWTFTIPAGKTYTFKTKIKATSKGTKKVVFNVNGKTQAKYFKVY
jgi:uncharacterized repeat protein (TIGR01451 family)